MNTALVRKYELILARVVLYNILYYNYFFNAYCDSYTIGLRYTFFFTTHFPDPVVGSRERIASNSPQIHAMLRHLAMRSPSANFRALEEPSKAATSRSFMVEARSALLAWTGPAIGQQRAASCGTSSACQWPATLDKAGADAVLGRAGGRPWRKPDQRVVGNVTTLARNLEALRLLRVGGGTRQTKPGRLLGEQPQQKEEAQPRIGISIPEGYSAMNRNNRKPKKANHGARPCSRYGRKGRKRRWGNPRR